MQTFYQVECSFITDAVSSRLCIFKFDFGLFCASITPAVTLCVFIYRCCLCYPNHSLQLLPFLPVRSLTTGC